MRTTPDDIDTVNLSNLLLARVWNLTMVMCVCWATIATAAKDFRVCEMGSGEVEMRVEFERYACTSNFKACHLTNKLISLKSCGNETMPWRARTHCLVLCCNAYNNMAEDKIDIGWIENSFLVPLDCTWSVSQQQSRMHATNNCTRGLPAFEAHTCMSHR